MAARKAGLTRLALSMSRVHLHEWLISRPARPLTAQSHCGGGAHTYFLSPPTLTTLDSSVSPISLHTSIPISSATCYLDPVTAANLKLAAHCRTSAMPRTPSTGARSASKSSSADVSAPAATSDAATPAKKEEEHSPVCGRTRSSRKSKRIASSEVSADEPPADGAGEDAVETPSVAKTPAAKGSKKKAKTPAISSTEKEAMATTTTPRRRTRSTSGGGIDIVGTDNIGESSETTPKESASTSAAAAAAKATPRRRTRSTSADIVVEEQDEDEDEEAPAKPAAKATTSAKKKSRAKAASAKAVLSPVVEQQEQQDDDEDGSEEGDVQMTDAADDAVADAKDVVMADADAGEDEGKEEEAEKKKSKRSASTGSRVSRGGHSDGDGRNKERKEEENADVDKEATKDDGEEVDKSAKTTKPTDNKGGSRGRRGGSKKSKKDQNKSDADDDDDGKAEPDGANNKDDDDVKMDDAKEEKKKEKGKKTPSGKVATSRGRRSRRKGGKSKAEEVDDEEGQGDKSTTTQESAIEPPSKKSKTKKQAATSNAAKAKTATSITPESTSPAVDADVDVDGAPAAEPEKQIDVAVHRVRHLNYIPRGINRLASTPLPPPTAASNQNQHQHHQDGFASSYIAVAREGGTVELLAVDQKWRGVAHVAGLRNREVDTLAWACGHGRGSGAEEDSSDDEDEDKTANKANIATTYNCISHQESERIHSSRRLFGASRDGTIFEIDFHTQRYVRVTPSGGGGVFCLASLCPECVCVSGGGDGKHSCCGGYLAAGCEDGTVKIYCVYSDDAADGSESKTLDLVSTLPSAGSAILSLAWRRGDGSSGKSGNDGLGGSVLYAGVADGTIRRYDCLTATDAARASGSSARAISTGSVLTAGSQAQRSEGSLRWRSTHRMTVETLGRRTPTKVWALKALSNGTVVSGDSLGHVLFWDGHSGTLMSKIVHNDNGADVLDLAVSSNECKVFASGVDSRVICIERIPPTSPNPNSGEAPALTHPSESKWLQTQAQRPHTHDVKSLCICYMKDPIGAGGAQSNAKGLGRELLCSGGVDTKLCTYLVSKFRQHRAKKVFPWPSSSPVSVARDRRVLALMRSDKIDLYRLFSGGLSPAKVSEPIHVVVDEDNTLLGSIEISSLYNLVSVDISSDGSLLATSDGGNLMIFSLDYVTEETEEGLRDGVVPTKLKVPKKARAACSAVKFAPDSSGRLFCATTNGPIKVLRIARNGNDDDDAMDEDDAPKIVSLEYNFDKHAIKSRHRATKYAASELAVSPCGKWIAARRFGMGSGTVLLFSVPESGGYKQWWSLPALEAPPSCIKFLGSKETENLAVACSNNSFYIFDHERRCLSDWSQDAGSPVSLYLPRELIHRADYPVRMAFNASNPSKFLLGAHGFFCIVDLDQPVPEHSNIFPPNHVRARRFVPKKSRANSIGDGGSGTDKDGAATGAGRKRKRSVSNADAPARQQSGNFTVCLRYSGMLFMDFIAENEMVVVEQPWMNVVNALPDALERRIYGS